MERMRVYWRRRRYERLDRSSRGSGKKRTLIHLGGRKGRSRFGRIKIKPRLRWLRRWATSPKKILIKIRDAYVKMMIGFANSAAFTGGGYGAYGLGDGMGATGFGRPAMKEYDEKIIVEIYKTLIAQQQLMAKEQAGAAATTAGTATSDIVLRR